MTAVKTELVPEADSRRTPFQPTADIAATDTQEAVEIARAAAAAVLDKFPVSSTDNAVARYDGATGDLQNSGVLIDDANALTPAANDGGALGTTALRWSDLFGATGIVVNFGNDWVATHTAGILTVGTGDLRITTAGTNAASVATVGGTQTLTGKTIALGSNTISGTLAQFNTALTGADFASLAGAETFTNKVLDGATVSTSLVPTTNDGAALGSLTNQFADLFLATSGIISWGSSTAEIIGFASTGGITVRADPGNTIVGSNFTIQVDGSTIATFTAGPTLATFPNVDINGGNIDGTVIGAATPAAITGTAIVGTSMSVGTGGVTTTGTVELGAASDTTLSRASAGVLAVEGVALLRANQNLGDVASAATSFTNIKQDATTTATGVVELATSQEVETGTDTTRAVVPNTLGRHDSVSKFWFVALVTAGVPAITSSYNMTSITDDGVGLLTATIATDFSSGAWVATGLCGNVAGAHRLLEVGATGLAAGSGAFACINDAGTASDPTIWCVTGFGDQ